MLVFSAIPADFLPELLAIEAKSNPNPWQPQMLSDCYKTHENCGAFVNNRLVAFIFYRLVAGEAEVIHLVCAREAQGKNYAYRLFLHVITGVVEAGVWHLEVRAHNHAAIKLYQRLGFVAVGRRKAYYQHKVDALLMTLKRRDLPPCGLPKAD